MADGMTPGSGNQESGFQGPGALCVLCLVACVCLLPRLAACADLDPTRPPSGLGDPLKQAGADAPLQVSSVFLMGNDAYALVAGQAVRLGDRLDLGAAAGVGRVTRIDESGVWLKTRTGLRQLRLLPLVKKTSPGKMEKR